MDIQTEKYISIELNHWNSTTGQTSINEIEIPLYSFNGVKGLSLTQVAMMVTVNRANQVEKEIIKSMEEIAEINKKLEIASKSANPLSECTIDGYVNLNEFNPKIISALTEKFSAVSTNGKLDPEEKITIEGTEKKLKDWIRTFYYGPIPEEIGYSDCQLYLEELTKAKEKGFFTYYDGFDAEGVPIEKKISLEEAIEKIIEEQITPTKEDVGVKYLDYEDSLKYYNMITREMDSLNSLNQENMINLQSFVNKRDQAYELGSNIDKLMFSGYMSVARSI